MNALYGRAEVTARARAAVARAGEGEGRLILLTGEPGIGKSTVAEYIAAEAASRGARVAWGRCWEAGGAPAYWPWIQVFRGLGMDEDPFAGATASVALAATEARFAAFDGAVLALRAKAAEIPLALVLDDLHAADASSLLLLLLLARQLRGSRTVVVGAYRDSEVRLTPEIASLLAKVAREAEVLPLPRLSLADVEEWMREAIDGASPGQAAELYRLTEGHPLFVVEALRVARSTDPPAHRSAGLEALLDEHLGRLSVSTRAILQVAAVLGRDFSTVDVAATAETAHDAVHRAITEAIAISVVVPAAEAERFRFSHVLLRDRLYAEILPSTRASLHFAAGTAILARDPQAPAAAVHHLFEGESAGRFDVVAEVAAAAAEAALSRLAFEEAARLARRTLRARGVVPELLEARLLVVLAESLMRLGETAEARTVCVQAAELAERIGAHELLARAALVYGIELLSGVLDEQMSALLRRALARVDEADSPLRARLMARLAAALTPSTSPEGASEILRLMRSALSMARRIDDRHTLLYVLQFAATVGLLIPEEERFSMIDETIVRATALDQRLVLLQSLPVYITALVGRGQRAEAEAILPRYGDLLAASRQPLHRVHWNLVHALLAAIDGDYEAADRRSAEARVIAERAGSEAGIRLCLTQRLSLALLRVNPELVVKETVELVAHFERFSSGAPYAAWTLLGLGRREEAAKRLAAVDIEPRSIPSANLMELHGAAETCILLGDTELALTLYPRLERAADRMFWNISPGAILGPMARTLGDLARMIGRSGEAMRHYDEAIALCEKIGAPSLVELCRSLRALVHGEGSSASTHRESPSIALALQRQGDVWAITSAHRPPLRLKHSKGLAYLHYLSEHPEREVHVLELAGIEHPDADAGPVLDTRAKDEYRRRLADLREHLAEAEQFGDVARAGRVEAEIDAIAEQLAGAVGLGGRDRRASSVVERTRINVQRCLKDAIERIAAADPALGRYLSAAVKSGTYCTYRPV